MEKELKSISCDPDCGFLIRSHDEMEVVEIAKKHAKEKHNMDVSDEDLKGKMKSEKM